MNNPSRLIFVCISNRVRSVLSEFFFPVLLREREPELVHRVEVSSAGFIPKTFKEKLERGGVSFPEPYYTRPMADITRAALLKKGIEVPGEWRSKALTPEMVRDADLIITALTDQKEELGTLYPDARAKFSAVRELAEWDDYFLFEDFSVLPTDGTFWNYVEGNSDYASETISLTEKTLIRAFPNILQKLGLVGQATAPAI